MLIFLALQYFNTPIGIFAGADNPLFYWVGYVVLLPGSLAYSPLSTLAKGLGISDDASIIAVCLAIGFTNTLLLAMLLRRVWRSDEV